MSCCGSFEAEAPNRRRSRGARRKASLFSLGASFDLGGEVNAQAGLSPPWSRTRRAQRGALARPGRRYFVAGGGGGAFFRSCAAVCAFSRSLSMLECSVIHVAPSSLEWAIHSRLPLFSRPPP